MKGKKELLANILFNSHVVNLFKRLPMRNKLIVLNYHRLRPSDVQFSTIFDEGVFSVDADEFLRQIKWLKNNTLILSERELLDCYRDGIFIHPNTSKPCVVITFDDGYRDNYTLAYPILKFYEVPAILFLSTQMIDDRQIAWWDIISFLIKGCTKPCLSFNGRQFLLEKQRKEAIEYFLLLMKQESYEHTKYLLPELSEACEVAFPDFELQDREILAWDEILEMAQDNIAVGSHTHTHRVLSTISSSAQKEEMILSKLLIEENIGQPVLSISYPVGELRHITTETFAIAEASGYLLGFTANTGVNDWKSIQPYAVKRTARLLEKVSTVSLLTVFPELFTWDTAASSLLDAMEAHPTYADAYYRLGIIQLGQNNIEKAIDNFQKAVEFNPNYTEARIKLGISQTFAGRYDEAEKNFLYILAKRPLFADIYYYLGIIHASKKQIPEAIQHLKKAVEINPAYKDAVLKLGILYCQQKQYTLALDMLESASYLDPADQELRELVETGKNISAAHGPASSNLIPLFASYIGSSEHIDELVQGFVTHLNISPNLNDIMTIVEKGTFSRDNLEALLLLFQEYKALFPEYADIRYMLGILYRQLDQMTDAERCFTESVALNPNYVKARLSLFNLLREQHRFEEAIVHGDALERFDLPYPDLYCGLAETYLGLGKYSEAEQFAGKAIAMRPAYLSAHQVMQKIRKLHDNG